MMICILLAQFISFHVMTDTDLFPEWTEINRNP